MIADALPEESGFNGFFPALRVLVWLFPFQRRRLFHRKMKNAMNKKKIQIQLSLTEFIYNGCFAAANFLSVFLEAIGFSAGQMGLISSLISGMGIISQPTWGVISDRVRSVKRCFMLCMVGTAAGAALVSFLSQGTGIWAYVLIAALLAMYFFFHPSNLMMELWLVRVNENPQLQIPYGTVRSWASIGYAVFSLSFVPIFRALSVRNIYFFLAGFAVISFFLAGRIPAASEGEGRAQEKQRLRDMPFRSILNYWVVGYIVFEVLYQIPFSWRVTYMVFALKEFGADTSWYGALMFLAGICEVPMLLLIKRFSSQSGLARPLLLSVLLLVLEHGMYAFGHSLAILFAAQLLRGFSYALYVACRHQYVYKLAPEGMEGSTQALVNAVSAMVNFLAAAAGGFLLEALGTRSFFTLLCVMQLFSGVFFAGVHLIGVKVLHRSPKDRQCMLFP